MRHRLVLALLAAPVLAAWMSSAARPQGREVWPVTNPSLTVTPATILSQPGQLIAFSCYNPNNVAGWVQVYDTTGAVVVGTTVPRTSLPLPRSSSSGMAQASTSSSGAVGVIALLNGMKVAAVGADGSSAMVSAVSCDFFTR